MLVYQRVNFSQLPALETNSLHLKRWAIPKGKDRLPTIHFQVPAVSFREGAISYPLGNRPLPFGTFGSMIFSCFFRWDMLVPWRVFIRQLVATEWIPDTKQSNVGRNLFVGFVFFVFEKPLHFITSRQLVRYESRVKICK